MLGVLPPTFKPVLQQTRLLQVLLILIYDWLKLRGIHAIHGIGRVTSLAVQQVCLRPVKYGKCANFVANSRTSLFFL